MVNNFETAKVKQIFPSRKFFSVFIFQEFAREEKKQCRLLIFLIREKFFIIKNRCFFSIGKS